MQLGKRLLNWPTALLAQRWPNMGACTLHFSQASEMNQKSFTVILSFSTDSESFQNSFCIDSETFMIQTKFQNICPLNSSDSEKISKCVSDLALNQNENRKFFPTLQTHTHKKNAFLQLIAFRSNFLWKNKKT